MTAWLNGEMRDLPLLQASDRGLTLGDGVYETIRAEAGEPIHLARHLARLRAGLDLLRIPLPYTDRELEGAIAEVLAGQASRMAVRLTVTRGPAQRGLVPPPNPTPTVLVTAAPAPILPKPVHLIIADRTRRNDCSPLAGIKSTNCLDAILARLEAADNGADNAILLNTRGRVAETTTANLFARFGDKVVTPPITEGALPGIIRALILDGLKVAEEPVEPGDLMAADDVVLTNSLAIQPVAGIHGRTIGSGDGGRLLSILRTAAGMASDS